MITPAISFEGVYLFYKFALKTLVLPQSQDRPVYVNVKKKRLKMDKARITEVLGLSRALIPVELYVNS